MGGFQQLKDILLACKTKKITAVNGISHQLRLNHESYNLWLSLWASSGHLTGPTVQLNIFWRHLAAHIYLAGHLGQLKNIAWPMDTNIQFWFLRFEKPYMTVAQLTR